MFSEISELAREINMKVNKAKTQLLCIHANRDCDINSYIKTPLGDIESKESLKILGFTFNKEPNATFHVTELVNKMYRKLWSLRFLKKSGMQPDKLLTVYKAIIRPTADYCSVVYNSIIPGYIADKLEGVQRHALRIIYGKNSDIDAVMAVKSIEKLSDRRNKKCLDFALKAVNTERFGKRWFPENNIERAARQTTRKRYVEKFTRHERSRNNPIAYMARLLNEHERQTGLQPD